MTNPPEPTKDEIVTLRATAKQKIDQVWYDCYKIGT